MSSSSADALEARIPGAFPEPADGTTQVSTPQSLAQRLFERRAEYTRPRAIRIKVGTWNVGGLKDTDKDLATWFVNSEVHQPSTSATAGDTDDPEDDSQALVRDGQVGIYALGLQEIVDVSSAAEALRPYADPTVPNRWKNSMQSALPPGYQLIAEQQLVGLLLLIYAAPAAVPHIKSVSTTSVGTGLMGYMGNKGAVAARIVLGETTRLVFINSHLAAGADKAALDRRNWDASQIVSRIRFSPIPDATGSSQGTSEGMGDEDVAFWFGDLNYRLEGIPGEDVRRLLSIHTRTLGLDAEVETASHASSDASLSTASRAASSEEFSENDIEIPPELDPASLQTTLSSLLSHDELHQSQKAGKAFHDGWEEPPIRFLPSYKYDVGKVGVFDSSDKRRGPSWCDRILYRTKASKDQYDARAREREEARRRDEELKARGVDRAGEDEEEVLYDYDPAADGDGDATPDDFESGHESEPEPTVGSEGYDRRLIVERYGTHLDIVSSDHKPLDAVFLLTFDAVVPPLKAAVRQDVAKELDRLENEQRPSVTVVVERSSMAVAQDEFAGADFGDVCYLKPSRRHVTIANTGRVPATIWMTGNTPTWLTVRFDKPADDALKGNNHGPSARYTVEPGEACSVELEVHVAAMETVRLLNKGKMSLDDVLVLHVAGGRDYFLAVRGRWLPSSFGRSIDALVRVPPGGIRKRQPRPTVLEEAVMWSVPREIFRLCEAIEQLVERTLAEWAMTAREPERAPWYNNAGWPFVKDPRYFANNAHEEELMLICEALDCGTCFNSAFEPNTTPMQKLELLSEVLLRFLKSLEDGVVTEAMWRTLDDGFATRTKSRRSSDDEKMWALEVLSSAPHHSASFLMLMTTLDRVASEICNAATQKQNATLSNIELPRSPQVSVRRGTLSKAPEIATRQLIALNYATVFADAIFRLPQMERPGDRENAARKDRVIDMMQLFLIDGH
ncbi:DNase I-like protein [Westerdykella ornata]|uniref:DNase I-like protein n=1 Tax=Westerdykella ornata TaxID=318751 RepID=A0A6A6J7E9_WESOR|nr:DNase I-like protein [Westerdykella ornata]KAF2272332.1 DNase I-like protein [Westerdykella ornata]